MTQHKIYMHFRVKLETVCAWLLGRLWAPAPDLPELVSSAAGNVFMEIFEKKT